MKFTLIAVDTAKLVFEVAEADTPGKVVRRLRLNRQQFAECLARRQKAEFVLEACWAFLFAFIAPRQVA